MLADTSARLAARTAPAGRQPFALARARTRAGAAIGHQVLHISQGGGPVWRGDLIRDSMRTSQRSGDHASIASHLLHSCGRDVTRARVGG